MPSQKIEFRKFDSSLRQLLGAEAPAPSDPRDAFRQLDFLESYLRDDEVDCSLVAVEEHYIDRDFMEDFSVFYSRSLSNFPNYCRRLHFFSGDPLSVETCFNALMLSSRSEGAAEFQRACQEFSENFYLGFSVIKPLRGTPVGRTILRPFPRTPGPGTTKGMSRQFLATRRYHAHILGVELSIQGLAFQQQDVGVAACATTAIWTSLQKNREREELGITTPAHITARATHNRMPFGRSMPSEGLSIDQMCQAVQSFGLSPVLSPAKDFITIRASLFAALQSDLSPVLVIQRANPDPLDQYHAVAVVGMKVSDDAQSIVNSAFSQASDHLAALYIHDDRLGPYLLAAISKHDDGVELRIRMSKRPRIRDEATGEYKATDAIGDTSQRWIVSHVLIPTHAKLRLSFPELHKIGLSVLAAVNSTLSAASPADTNAPRTNIDFWVDRSHVYIGKLASSRDLFSPNLAVAFAGSVALSRYIGVVRMQIAELGTVDFVVDTTSTEKNLVFLGAICSNSAATPLRKVTEAIGKTWGVPVF